MSNQTTQSTRNFWVRISTRRLAILSVAFCASPQSFVENSGKVPPIRAFFHIPPNSLFTNNRNIRRYKVCTTDSS
jgi:hypothetical protein